MAARFGAFFLASLAMKISAICVGNGFIAVRSGLLSGWKTLTDPVDHPPFEDVGGDVSPGMQIAGTDG